METRKQVRRLAIIQLRNNDDLYQDCGDASGETWSEPRCILKMKPKLSDLIDRIWGLEERAESRLVAMFSPEKLEGWSYYLLR